MSTVILGVSNNKETSNNTIITNLKLSKEQGYKELIEIFKKFPGTTFIICQPSEFAPLFCFRENIDESFKEIRDVMISNRCELIWIFGGLEYTTNNSGIDLCNRVAVEKYFKVYLDPCHFGYLVLYNILKDSYVPAIREKDTVFTCVNRGPWDHRCVFIDTLEKYKLIEDNFVTWINPKVANTTHFSFFDNRKLVIDTDFKIDSNGTHLYSENYKWHALPDYANRSLVNIVVESTDKVHFITEKTWKCIFGLMPFVIVGKQEANAKLFDLGFKEYDFIDYSFEHIKDRRKRYEALGCQLKKLEGKDLNKLFEENLKVIEHNFNKGIELTTNRLLYPENILRTAINYNEFTSGQLTDTRDSRTTLDKPKLAQFNSIIQNILKKRLTNL